MNRKADVPPELGVHRSPFLSGSYILHFKSPFTPSILSPPSPSLLLPPLLHSILASLSYFYYSSPLYYYPLLLYPLIPLLLHPNRLSSPSFIPTFIFHCSTYLFLFPIQPILSPFLLPSPHSSRPISSSFNCSP